MITLPPHSKAVGGFAETAVLVEFVTSVFVRFKSLAVVVAVVVVVMLLVHVWADDVGDDAIIFP